MITSTNSVPVAPPTAANIVTIGNESSDWSTEEWLGKSEAGEEWLGKSDAVEEGLGESVAVDSVLSTLVLTPNAPP